MLLHSYYIVTYHKGTMHTKRNVVTNPTASFENIFNSQNIFKYNLNTHGGNVFQNNRKERKKERKKEFILFTINKG